MLKFNSILNQNNINRVKSKMQIKKECVRCGVCCLVDMIAYVTDKDIERWHREGRFDILNIVNNSDKIWAGDRIISSKGNRSVYSCYFLQWDEKKACCEIYETRPDICRNFQPGESELCSQY